MATQSKHGLRAFPVELAARPVSGILKCTDREVFFLWGVTLVVPRESSSWRIPTRQRGPYWFWILVLSMSSSSRAGCASGMPLRELSATTSRPSESAS